MTLSYAEAMKKKQSSAPPAASVVQKSSDGPKSATVAQRASKHHPAQTPSQQPQHSRPRDATSPSVPGPKPPPSAWGKQGADSAATQARPRNPQNPWGQPAQLAARPAPPPGNQKSSSSAKNTPVRILRQEKPAGSNGPPSSSTNSSPQIGTNQQQRPTPKPQTNQTTVNKPPAKGAQQQQPKQQQAPQQSAKSKRKPKPQLKSMSIGDMIATQPSGKGKNARPQAATAPTASLAMDSTRDFPALGSSSTTSGAVGSKSLLAKSTWGKPAASSAKPTAAESASKKPKAKGPAESKTNKPKPNNNNNAAAPSAPSAATFFQPKTDTAREGDEHQLLRLVQDRTVYQKKGRQRLNPRKKKFTALKKKVLQERLDKWHALHPEEKGEDSRTATAPDASTSSCTVCIYNYVHPDEVQEDDEYQEILENLQEMASKVGNVQELLIPRQALDRTENFPAFVRFATTKEAAAAQACWDGLMVAGDTLRVVLVPVGAAEDAEWKEMVIRAESSMTSGEAKLPDSSNGRAIAVITLPGILTEEDYEDEDCMTESLEDLKTVAGKFGSLQSLEPSESKDGSVTLTYEAGPSEANEILMQLQGITIGGRALTPHIVTEQVPESSILILENVLTDDDLEDEDCLVETLGDLRELVGRHGKIKDLQVGADRIVKVIYEGPLTVAEESANALNGLTLGGVPVVARAATNDDRGDTMEEDNCVYLSNILTEDDLEDDDCLRESLSDIRAMASRHGKVREVEVVKEEGSSLVRIAYDEGEVHSIKSALEEFEGMVVGGLIVSAKSRAALGNDVPAANAAGIVVDENDAVKRKSGEEDDIISKKARTDDSQPLYSGDKLIPERFAQAKRVPKIPNNPGPREYAKETNDERVRPLLTEMLGELMRLQKRAVEENNTKAKRRLVMGLREVARGIRSHKVKMVIMANNLDEYGVIDEKLQEIIDLAHNEGVPLFFEFTKRSLGKAVGKSIKVAVVGVQNAEGAHQPFKKLVTLASKL